MPNTFGPWREQSRNFPTRQAAIDAVARLKTNYPDSEFKVLSRGRVGGYTVKYREPKYRRSRSM